MLMLQTIPNGMWPLLGK